MKKLNLTEIHDMELELLDEFCNFCLENNLRFYLAGGTLLGAIRHNGFIPWDDDIDVVMPRPDYQKFVNTFSSRENIKLFCKEKGNMMAPFSKLKRIDTIVIDPNSTAEADINTNLWIDIFPVDGVPEDLEETKKIYSESMFWRRMLVWRTTRYGIGKNVFQKVVKIIFKIFLSWWKPNFFANKLDDISKRYDYKLSKFVGVVGWGLYGKNERMEKSKFEEKTEVNFEGRKMPAFSCWNEYLTNLYGNYMKLPPIKDRAGHKMDIYLI